MAALTAGDRLRRALAREMRRAVPGLQVCDRAETLRPYECDGLTAYRCLPLLAVLPADTLQVQGVLAFCAARGVPVVARGAGTSLSGGALPLEDGVLLGLARLDRILEIDADNRIARVEPGVRNLQVSEQARRHGLYYAPDPSSQVACSIGGNIAENSGGVHCLKYGLTVHNVSGVELITIDGQRLRLGGGGPDAPGYDLTALVCGSEGMLGVVVEATLRLLPRPESVCVLLAAFDSVREAGDAVAAVIASGIIPAGLEMMDRLATRAVEAYAEAGYPVDAEAVLLCELDGCEAQVLRDLERVRKLLREAGAAGLREAVGEEACRELWAGRKAAFPAVGRLTPDYYCIDGTIPRRYLSEMLGYIAAESAACGLRVANVFHAGDGNLHPLICYDAACPGELEKAEALGARILEECVRVGGTITGEHGVGVEKLDSMCVQFSDAERRQFHALKHAFDPGGLLNPGKAVPSMARCAEFGALHVQGGCLPHPELERF